MYIWIFNDIGVIIKVPFPMKAVATFIRLILISNKMGGPAPASRETQKEFGEFAPHRRARA